jgi:hypothetical protein
VPRQGLLGWAAERRVGGHPQQTLGLLDWTQAWTSASSWAASAPCRRDRTGRRGYGDDDYRDEPRPPRWPDTTPARGAQLTSHRRAPFVGSTKKSSPRSGVLQAGPRRMTRQEGRGLVVHPGMGVRDTAGPSEERAAPPPSVSPQADRPPRSVTGSPTA